MTSFLSMAQFQAAMQSNDPGALGSIEMSGQTWNVKDAIEGGTGLNNDNITQPATAKEAIASASSAIPEAAVSGADIAIAILQVSTQAAIDTDQDNDDGLQKESTATRPATTGQAASDATMSFSGSSKGMMVFVAVVAASAASTPTVASATGVSLVA